MPSTRIVPPGTPPSTLPPPPRRRFADGTVVTDKTYVLRTKNWTYLREYGDTPTFSGQRRPSFLATYLLAAIICVSVAAVMQRQEEDAAEARLAREGMTTSGVVTAVKPIYRGKTSGVVHYRVDFRFTTPARDGQGETTHMGIGRTRDRELPGGLRPGTPIVVRYVPDAPHLVQVVSPPLQRSTTTLQERRGALIVAIPALFYPPRLVVWWLWVWRRERHLTRHGLLLRAEIVGVRRGGWGLWERHVVTYHFRTPEGESITAEANIEYARSPESEAKAAVLYLNRERFALL